MSKDHAAHVRAVREYGGWDNFQAKRTLDANDRPLGLEYATLSGTFFTEEEIVERMVGGVPYFMDSVTLASIPLHLIGAPDGSTAHTAITEKRDFRALRRPEFKDCKPLAPFWFDYSDLGWPLSQGAAQRMVSPEEHREILRRLKTSSLTRPGSDVVLKGQSLSSLIDEDLPQPAWIIEGILREGGAMMVYGPSGIGKTWFVHTLMLMAAHGNSIGIQEDGTDRWVLRAGPHKGYRVGLIDGEMRKEDIAERAVTLCGVFGLRPGGSENTIPPIEVAQLRLAMESDGVPSEDIALWTSHMERRNAATSACVEFGERNDTLDLSKIDLRLKTDQDPKVIFPDLVDTEWKQQIIEYTKSMGIKVLILDNLSTLSPSLEDENASAQVAPLNDLIVALKQAGVATILVHHSGKSKDGGYRGSSALQTVLETSIQLEAVGEKGLEARFKVTFPKGRVFAARHLEGRTLRLEMPNGGVRQRWVAEVDPMGQIETLLRALKTLRYTTQTELGLAVGMTQPEVSKALMAAYVAEIVTKDAVTALWAKAKTMKTAMASGDFTDDTLETLDI